MIVGKPIFLDLDRTDGPFCCCAKFKEDNLHEFAIPFDCDLVFINDHNFFVFGGEGYLPAVVSIGRTMDGPSLIQFVVGNTAGTWDPMIGTWDPMMSIRYFHFFKNSKCYLMCDKKGDYMISGQFIPYKKGEQL